MYWKGVEVNLSERMTFKNLRLVNNDGHIHSIGIDNSSNDTRDRHSYENTSVEGFATGMIVPRQGLVTVDRGAFANHTNFRITNPVQDHRDVLINGITTDSHPSYPQASYTEIAMSTDFSSPVDKHPLYFMLPDRIVLNYGAYTNQQLYFDEQERAFVPIRPGSEQSDEGQIVPSLFVGLSNQQLLDRYQLSFGGSVLPAEAVSVPHIVGGKMGAYHGSTLNMPICVGYTASGRFLKTSNFPDIHECIGASTNFVARSLSPYAHAVDGSSPTSSASECGSNG